MLRGGSGAVPGKQQQLLSSLDKEGRAAPPPRAAHASAIYYNQVTHF